ncbi:MAG: helix-turn-helix domain-containing protein [Actinomycetota bacterium]|nr:helix-turn-helix domain-containing protein [Actinomycetota bacterium]
MNGVDEVFTKKGLLSAEDVAGYLGVGQVTVYRWCREGRLPCLKIGKSWRIRRSALEDFLRQGERSATLVGQLRSFLEVPDNVIGIAQDLDLLHRLDAAFFRVGEARGGLLVKYVGGEPQTSLDELRAELDRNGLDVARLEQEGRFRFVVEPDPNGRAEALRRLLDEEAGGRSIWVSFDWAKQIDLDTALRQQEALSGLAEAGQLVIKTALLEWVADDWPPPTQRRAQALHSGTVWISEAGLALSRVTPLPST